MPPSEKGPDIPKSTTAKPREISAALETKIGRGDKTDVNLPVVNDLTNATKKAATKAATPPPEAPAIPKKPTPSEAAAKTQEKVAEAPWVPLVQVDPGVEAEIRDLIKLCQMTHEQARKRKADIERTPLKKEDAKHWSASLLGLIEKLDAQVRSLPKKTHAAEVVTSLRSGILSVWDRMTVGDTLQPEVDTEHPTVAGALMYELTVHRSLDGKVTPAALGEAVDYLMESMANRRNIGDGPYGRIPSKEAAAFAMTARARIPVVKPEVGVTNRFRPWNELVTTMQQGTSRIVQEGAYNEVLERVVGESGPKRAPSAQEPDDVRRKYDETLQAAIDTARSSDFHRETPVAKRRAIESQLSIAEQNLRKRGLVQPKAAEDPKKK